ncbi:hypothetical protein CWS01_16480 [Niallia nealsonii]|uniref:Uncharacterized protein n=1 Tax=Niallia nealsonii TaxID=115979 RepID=A0A2N0YZ37_9BACI|nr:hypothetical protein CWS01_16480 [Niallia nealsonii]
MRLLWEQRDRRDPTVAGATRRLTARPTESEHPEAEISLPQCLVNSNKVYENSLNQKGGLPLKQPSPLLQGLV